MKRLVRGPDLAAADAMAPPTTVAASAPARPITRLVRSDALKPGRETTSGTTPW